MTRKLILAGVSCLPMVFAPVALAQASETAAQESVTAPQAGFGEEIIVTARKTEENLQNVPVAITAFSGEQLRARNILQPSDLQASTPSLTTQASPTSGRNNITYNIRGQGAPFGTPPGVPIYFADAPTASDQPIFYDIESIQVLKGPQGTLFGRTSTGGAVLIAPRKPTFEFEGYVQARIGNLSQRAVEGAINVPIIDDLLAVRLAGQLTRREGFTRSLDDGKLYDDIHRESLRLSIAFTPGPLRNDFLLQYDNINENGQGYVLTNTDTTGASLNLPVSVLGAVCGGAAALSGVPGNAAFRAGCVAQRTQLLADARNALAAEVARVRSGAQGGIRAFRSNGDQFYRQKKWLLTNRTTLDLGSAGPWLEDIEIKNIFAYRFGVNLLTTSQFDGTNQRQLDQTYQVYGLVPGICQTSGVNIGQCTPGIALSRDDIDPDDWSEEVNVSAKVATYLNLLGGYFYSRVYRDLTGGITSSVLNDVTQPLLTPTVSNLGNISSKSWEDGIFVQGTLDLGFLIEGVSFTAGHRWTRTSGDTLIPSSFGASTGTRNIRKESAKTYTLSAEWQVNRDILIYGRHGTGYKPGGQNALCVANPIPGCTAEYSPESVSDFEVGGKLGWDIWDITGRTNVAIYRSNYADIQRPIRVGGSQYVANAAEARIKGFELDHTMNYGGFGLSTTYSYTDAKFTRAFRATAGFPCTDPINNSSNNCQDVSNLPFQNVPKHQLNITLRGELPLPKKYGQITPSISYYRQSKVNFSDNPADSRFTTFPSYTTISGRIDWNNVMDHPIDIALFARNLTNKVYPVFIADLSRDLGVSSTLFAEPRTYGVELRYRFGSNAR